MIVDYLMDEDSLEDHPIKLYEGWVEYVRSVVMGVGFAIPKVNRLHMVCTKIILDEYHKANEGKKKLMEKLWVETEKKLVDEKYLPDLDKDKKT